MKVMKNALTVESKKPTLPEDSVKISNILYWKVFTKLYQERPEAEWYEVSEMDLDKMWFGLKEIPYEISFDDYRFFEVIDKQKYLWAKLKYGI